MRKLRAQISDPMNRYQAGLAVAAIGFFALLVMTSSPFSSPLAVAGLALTAAIAERVRVRLGTEMEASISLVPTVFTAVLFGPVAAMLVAGASFLGDFPPLLRGERREVALARGRPFLKWGTYTCTRALTGGAAGVAAAAVVGLVDSDVAGVVLATLVAAFVAEPLDVGFVALTMKFRGLRSIEALRALAPVTLASIPLYTPVVAVLCIAYRQLSPWTLPLFFVPALAAQRLFALYQQQRRLTDDLVGANARLEAVNLSFASALVATLDARDRYTAGHSAAVAIYARDIAARLSLSTEAQNQAHLAGLVHDIGKIGLPAGLLEKPGALTLDERRHMEQHPVIGERILAKVDNYGEIAAIVRHHHERVDGQGYPDGLDGNEIPLLARIIAVADAYNAMTSDRPYRDAMPSRVARLRLAQAVDSQFDTAVVAAFEAVLASASEAYRLGQRPDFRFEIQDDGASAPFVGEVPRRDAAVQASS